MLTSRGPLRTCSAWRVLSPLSSHEEKFPANWWLAAFAAGVIIAVLFGPCSYGSRCPSQRSHLLTQHKASIDKKNNGRDT